MPKSNDIYLDYASATPLAPSVLSVMDKTLKENFANAGSIHDLGVKAQKILEESRREVAEILGAHSDEIIFTSGATESNNLAILGIITSCSKIFSHCALPGVPGGTLADKKFKNIPFPHIVTTNIEHSSVLEVCKYLERTKQAEVTFVQVEENGVVDSRKIRKALRPNTVLVSVMYANNEIGTIQPIMEIAKEIRHFRKTKRPENFRAGLDPSRGPEKILLDASFPIFHTDATQAINYLPIKVEKLGIDLMSFNAGKIYGPKGVGVLYAKRKTPISKIMHGGEQEFGLRPGTENISSIAGLTEAFKITENIKEKEAKRLLKLRDYFIQNLYDLKNQNSKFSRVLGLGPDQLENFSFNFLLNGDLEKKLPNNINITIPKIPSDLLVLELSARGIYISEKSACKSGDKKGSYVIEAISQRKDLWVPKGPSFGQGSLRFSLGRETSKADLDNVIKALSEILKKLQRWYN